MTADIEQAVSDAVSEQEQPRIKTLVYTFEGTSYTIRKDAVEDLEVLEWIEDEKIIKALKRILGDEQWEKFKDSQRDERTGAVGVEKLEGFVNGLFEKLNAGKA